MRLHARDHLPEVRRVRAGGTRKRRAFSLVELLLAVSLWASAFLSIFALYTTCRGAVVRSGNIMYASHVAQSTIESLRFVDYANVASQGETAVTSDYYFGGQRVRTTFYYTVNVTPNAANTVKDIYVEVVWQELGFNGSARSSWKNIKMQTKVISQ